MAERFAPVANRLAHDSHWEPVTATIIDSTYHYARLRDLSPDDYLDHSFFVIRFSYLVNGKIIEDQFEQADPIEPGSQIEIFYDPEEPGRNTLQKPKYGWRYWLFVGIFCLGFLFVINFLHDRLDLPPFSNF